MTPPPEVPEGGTCSSDTLASYFGVCRLVAEDMGLRCVGSRQSVVGMVPYAGS